jgi:hypothetical protein
MLPRSVRMVAAPDATAAARTATRRALPTVAAALLLLLPPPGVRGSCASHHHETQPCCGQIARDPGCATGSCTVDAAHRCGATLPVCTNYAYNRWLPSPIPHYSVRPNCLTDSWYAPVASHFGTCVACPAATAGGCAEPAAKQPDMLKLVESGVCPPCNSSWGLTMIVALGVAVALYVGGGVGCAVKAQGAAPGIAAHPHYDRMVQLAGLVQDGTTFFAMRLQNRGGARAKKEASAPLLAEARSKSPPGTEQHGDATEPA